MVQRTGFKNIHVEFPLRLVLLVYTFFCVSLYDPVVSVDDTPRKPIFEKILNTSGVISFLKSRDKLQQDLPDSTLCVFIPEESYSTFVNVNSILKLTFLVYQNQFHISRFSKHSISIRAPSLA